MIKEKKQSLKYSGQIEWVKHYITDNIATNNSAIETDFLPNNLETNTTSSISNYSISNKINKIVLRERPASRQTSYLAFQEESFFANSTTYTNIYWDSTDASQWISTPPLSPGERMRQMIRDRMAPTIRMRRALPTPGDIREERARETLRRILGEQSFRKFLRDGFITVVAKSGLTYRIFPGHGITEVYDRGIMVERLCVVLKGNFPPTDSLIMRYLLILNDEGEFSEYAVKHAVWSPNKRLVVPKKQVSLAEEWAHLKCA